MQNELICMASAWHGRWFTIRKLHRAVRILPSQPASAVSVGHIQLSERPRLPRVKGRLRVSAARNNAHRRPYLPYLAGSFRSQILNIRISVKETWFARTGDPFKLLRAGNNWLPTRRNYAHPMYSISGREILASARAAAEFPAGRERRNRLADACAPGAGPRGFASRSTCRPISLYRP
jgi:hypothetical protein